MQGLWSRWLSVYRGAAASLGALKDHWWLVQEGAASRGAGQRSPPSISSRGALITVRPPANN